ncbi:MAG: replicative DNA helicase [Lachnospiraceae bacterium]|nr:replicative DNA helicase [Lachnospiraceae bacterium]
MEEQVIKRIMPNDPRAEQSVIGSMLLDRDAIITAGEIIKGEDFYNPQFGVIFDTICELFNLGTAVDPVTLQNKLREKDVPPEVYSDEFISDCIGAVPSSLNVKEYAEIVHRKSITRRLIRVTESIANTCYQGREELDTILDRTEKEIFDVLQYSGTGGDFTPISQIVTEVLDRVDRASRAKSIVTGLPSGFRELDRMLAGFQKSNLIIIAARPAMGKTAFALNLVNYISIRNSYKTALFSLEMNADELCSRLLSMHAGIDGSKLRTGALSSNEWVELVHGAGPIAQANLFIDDRPGISPAEVRRKCRKLKLEKGLDLIIIDYLQLMSASGRRNDSRQNEISEISRSLKIIAKELQVPLIALAQLSRAPDQRKDDHRPIISDLRESGSIEQDADVVMFLYRDEVYNKETEKKNIAEVIVGKQRSGSLGTVELAWMPERTKFGDLEKNNTGNT